jgi:hypothetical protein
VKNQMDSSEISMNVSEEIGTLQFIKNSLKANEQSISHILLISIDDPTPGNSEDFFKRLANETNTVQTTIKGATNRVELTWECSKTERSSNIYYTGSLFNDYIVSMCTKKIIAEIATALNIKLTYLVTTPMKYFQYSGSAFTLKTQTEEYKSM